MATKPIKFLELHYTMTQFLIRAIIIHQIFSLTRDWSIFPNFENCARCEKDLKDNKDNSRHLARKYARIFVLGHYLFLVAHSFPRASLLENCSLLGTDNVSEHIFAPNSDYCLYNCLIIYSKYLHGKTKR